MPPKDTPPNSPPEIIEEEDPEDDDFNENDIAEVYEIDGDEELENGIDDDVGEPIIEEQEEYEPETDDSKLIFSKHTGETLDESDIFLQINNCFFFFVTSDGVLCCAFHPESNNVAVTGGIDDLAYVWDVTDSSVLFICRGHEVVRLLIIFID